MMSKWMSLIRLVAVVAVLGFYMGGATAKDSCDPNKPSKMSWQKDGAHDPNCRDANDPNKPKDKGM